MTKEVFEIKGLEKRQILYNMEDLLINYKRELGRFGHLSDFEKDTIKTINDTIQSKRNELDVSLEDLKKFFTDKFERYWSMTITIYKNNLSYQRGYVIYPYKIVESNGYLCALLSETVGTNCGYNFSFQDGGILLDELYGDECTIEMEEITKEEFIAKCNNKINDMIDFRLKKNSQKDDKPKFEAVWV